MASWLDDIFGDDAFQTVVNGFNTAGSIFNAASPLINRGAQLALGLEGTRNAQNNIAGNQQVLTQLNDMFSPTGDYAKELRNQLERKDAAAGRRSQYGTRETELMTALAKQKAAVLTSPAYQNYLAGANRSAYAPIGGAVGNITTQQGAQNGQRTDANGNKIPNVPTSTAQYLANLFGPGAEASIASLGGAGSALTGANTPAALGVVDELGSMFGNPYLPGYADTATGIFGATPGTSAGAGGGGSDLAGSLASGFGDWLGGAGSFGGAGTALSGMGSGSLAGTVGGADTLGSMFGGTGFLPGYTSTGASSLFGGAGAGAEAAGAGAAAGGGGAGAAGAGLSGMALPALTALPFLVAAGGMLGSMFGMSDDYDPRTQQQIAQTTYGNLKDYLNNQNNSAIYRGWNGGDMSQIRASDLGNTLEDYMSSRGINAGAGGYTQADYENALRGGGNLYAMSTMPGQQNPWGAEQGGGG